MSEGIQPEVVLNELGELSRKSRRELLAHGLDPDAAVVEHIRTQSIPLVGQFPASSPSPAPTPAPAPTPTQTPEPLSFADLLRGNVPVAPPPAPYSPAPDSPAPVSPAAAVPPAFVPPPFVPPALAPTPAAPSVYSTSPSRRDVRNLRERSENAPETPFSFDGPVDGSSEATAADTRGGFEAFSISTMSSHSTGIIPTTGSALILPTLPEHAPGAVFSFDQTGEILLTGSISLPMSIGQYGADVLTLDTSDVDMVADDVYKTSSSQHLAPVRATNAVSAYSTSNTVTTVPSRFRDRLPFILAITAAGLAVGVVALCITGYVLGVF